MRFDGRSTRLHDRLVVAFVSCVLATASVAPRAAAQGVEVRVEKDRPSLGVHARLAGVSDTLVLCAPQTTSCVASVVPGRYRVEVTGDRYAPSASSDVLLLHPGRLEITAGSKALRDGGTAVWIGGVAAMALGLVGLTFAGTSGEPKRSTAPAIVLGSGVLLTLTGFFMTDRAATRVAFAY